MKEKNGKSALTVARPGRLRDSLNAFLVAVPQIAVVDKADDGPTALEMVAESPPALVLLDTNAGDGEVYDTLRQIKTRWPQTRCIVLTDDVKQQQIARSAGADETLLRGFSIMELFASVERLFKNHNRVEENQETPK